jgi:hypothetical protein
MVRGKVQETHDFWWYTLWFPAGFPFSQSIQMIKIGKVPDCAHSWHKSGSGKLWLVGQVNLLRYSNMNVIY